MNMNRLIPAKGDDLAVWLSSVVHDAIRDARDAGLSAEEAHTLLEIITRQHDPNGWKHDRYTP